MPLLVQTEQMKALLQEPAIDVAGLGVEVDTATDTATFLWDSTDGDSDVVFERERGFDVNGNLIRQTAWAISNDLTVSGIATNEADPLTVSASGETQLTITGTNYGAQDDDITVILMVQPRVYAGTRNPTRGDNRIVWEASITSINVGDTQIVCTVDLSDQMFPYKVPEVGGDVEVYVYNHKRKLRSAPFSLTVVA
jgi:hypothetical protein